MTKNERRKFVTGLFIYPIKSCRGIAVESALVTEYGFENDRRFVLCDKRGIFVTQRAQPRLALVRTHIEGDALHLSAPQMPDISLPLHADGEEATVRLFKDTCTGLVMDDRINQWFSRFLGITCRLLRYMESRPRIRESSYLSAPVSVSYADGYPFLITSEQSLNYLNTKLQEPITMNRFRPNIIVNGVDGPHDEDQWKEILIGDDVILTGANTSARCVMITIDQTTGMLHSNDEPRRTLQTYRKFGERDEIFFGKNFMPITTESAIRVDDTITVVSVT